MDEKNSERRCGGMVSRDKMNLYIRGKYSFPSPPVSTRNWSDTDWIKYIDRNGIWHTNEEEEEGSE